LSLTIFLVVVGGWFLGMIALGLYALVDWRKFFLKRYGNDYRKGLALFKAGTEWIPVVCDKLHFDGEKAKTYKVTYGDKTYYPIVPDMYDSEGKRIFEYYKGYRVFRVLAGGAVGVSGFGGANENSECNYDAELISSHVMDRVAVEYGKSVTSENKIPWVMILIAMGIVIVAIVVLKLTGIIGSAPVVTPTPGVTPGASPEVTPVPSGTLSPMSLIISCILGV
jgi:hypothetical protein